MKIKKLKLNVVNYLPYQEPIKKGAIIEHWFFEMKYKKENQK